MKGEPQVSRLSHGTQSPGADAGNHGAPHHNGVAHVEVASPVRQDIADPSVMAPDPAGTIKARMMRNVTAGAAHDLTNLLCVIGFDLTSLESESLSPKGAQVLSSLRTEITYLRGLARELHLAAAEVEAPNIHHQTRLAAWWPDMNALLRSAHRDGVVVTTDIPWGLPAVSIRPRHLTQIVLNLAGNSTHAISERIKQNGVVKDRIARSGEIRFSARLASGGGMIELKVSDDGAGMTPEVLSRACEPHFTTRGSSGGTGLGLALVRRLIEDAGGVLRLESTVDGGTTVTMELPTRGV